MNLTRQDGFPPGTLSSFTITESGLIRGIFSNGAERPLGQILMASFANNGGLQQVGENLFAQGVNSGEAVYGRPGESGIGTLTAGALELSNTDIGQNLIELILASTQYRGGARVITTAQELLDELLSLRR
jgi:flagellar hook protein FlgE